MLKSEATNCSSPLLQQEFSNSRPMLICLMFFFGWLYWNDWLMRLMVTIVCWRIQGSWLWESAGDFVPATYRRSEEHRHEVSLRRSHRPNSDDRHPHLRLDHRSLSSVAPKIQRRRWTSAAPLRRRFGGVLSAGRQQRPDVRSPARRRSREQWLWQRRQWRRGGVYPTHDSHEHHNVQGKDRGDRVQVLWDERMRAGHTQKEEVTEGTRGHLSVSCVCLF